MHVGCITSLLQDLKGMSQQEDGPYKVEEDEEPRAPPGPTSSILKAMWDSLSDSHFDAVPDKDIPALQEGCHPLQGTLKDVFPPEPTKEPECEFRPEGLK